MPWPVCHVSLLLAAALCTPTWAHQLPPPLGKFRGAASAVVGRYIFCDPPLSSPCHLTGEVLHKTWAFLMSSFWHFILWLLKGKGVPKTREERIERKVRCIFPSSIWNLFYTPHFKKNWSISYSFALTGVLVLIKNNHNLYEIKVATRFFFFSLKMQNRFKEGLL